VANGSTSSPVNVELIPRAGMSALTAGTVFAGPLTACAVAVYSITVLVPAKLNVVSNVH
jgi:hypothetical protein